MAERRFYWLKLKDDFFSNKVIKKLRRIAGGDTYTIIYLKMLLKSIKNDGMIIYEGVEPTLEEEIALDIDEDVDNVKMTISFLKNNGLLLETDNPNEYALPETIENIGSESAAAERMRNMRNRNIVTQPLRTCYVEKEKRERDREEIDKEKMLSKDNNMSEVVDEKEIMFNEFWSIYPKKIAKKRCLTAYKKIKNLKEIHQSIIQNVLDNKNSKQWTKENGQYIPNPLTYINQERWLEVVEVPQESKYFTDVTFEDYKKAGFFK